MASRLSDYTAEQLIEALRSKVTANKPKRRGNRSPLDIPVDALIYVLEALFNVFFDWYIETIRRLVRKFARMVKRIGRKLFCKPSKNA